MHQRLFAVLLGVGVLTLSGSAYPRAVGRQDSAPSVSSRQALIDQYCVTCHNQRAKTGGLTLDNVDVANIGDNPELWERVVRKLQGNLMPPQGLPRPDAATYAGFLSYLETSLDRGTPDPGRTEALHRLNRVEYRNAVRDLLALDIDVGSMLPADDVSYGFDNIAGVQRMSPTLMERYIAAAQKISSVAVGASPRAATTDTFPVPPELRQDDRVEGLPFGTRGGASLRYTFPRDGEYAVRVQLTRYAGASFDDIPVFDETQKLELSVDGNPLHVFELEAGAGRGDGPGPNRRTLDARSDFPQRQGRGPSRSRSATERRRCSKTFWSRSRSRFREAPTVTTRHRRARIFERSKSRAPSTPPVPEIRRAVDRSSSAGPPGNRRKPLARRGFFQRWPDVGSGGL
jgi:hypothetical protein